MKKLVIFDFDGVIENTLELALTLVGEQMPGLTLEEFQSWFDTNFYQAVKEKGIPFDGSVYYPKYETALRERVLDPEIKKDLETLHEHASLAIVSSSHDDALKEYVERNGVAHLFDEVWGAATHKSKVEKLKGLMKAHHVLPEETVFVTDTLGDIREAREAGIESVAVTWGFHPKERLLKGNPQSVVETPKELLEVLSRNV